MKVTRVLFFTGCTLLAVLALIVLIGLRGPQLLILLVPGTVILAIAVERWAKQPDQKPE